MPACPNCGSQQPDGAAFCDDCGAKLGEVAPAAMPAAAPPPPVPPTPTAWATTCSVCGASVAAGESFCDNCGAALGQAGAAPAAAPAPAAPAPAAPLVCPACGAPLEAGSRFCDMCGAATSAPVAAPSAPAPVPAPPPQTPAPAPAPAPQPQAPAPAPAPAPVAPAPPPPMAAVPGRLVVQGTNATLPFPPGKTEIFVGREDPVSGVFPEIDLSEHGGDEGGVSRKHARIFVQGSQVYIEDLNSTNYTYVNQQKILSGQPTLLNDGDEVRFGRVKVNYYA